MSKCDGSTWCKSDKHIYGCFASDNPVLILSNEDVKILDESENN